jgi:5-epimerase
MKARRLAVAGALEFSSPVHSDVRGDFITSYLESALAGAHGPPFTVAQASHSISRRGVVRGVHYTATPPGAAKYVSCIRGTALDIVVDIRLGSPTWGRWDAVRLDEREFRAVYVPVGVGHAFVALRDETVVHYLTSQEYDARREWAVSALDPALGLPIPDGLEPIMSERDRAAPTRAQARAAGRLPDYARCTEMETGAR